MRQRVASWAVRVFLTAGIAVAPAMAGAAVYRVGDAAGLQSKTALLQPGDELVVSNGTYTLGTWSIQNISGARTNWITIHAVSNAVIRGTSTTANVIQFGNAHYLAMSNFEVVTTAPTNYGIDGINIKDTDSSYLVFDHMYVHGVGNVGFNIQAPTASFITLRNSEIASNGLCGLYWGYPGTKIVHDVLIANNYIHHCPINAAQQEGYGIQFKGWSYRARIVDNVLHDVGGTTRSGIIVYYGKTPLQGDVPDDMNIVRGNVLWNCRNEGITAMADALVENNIVFDAATGLNLQGIYNDGSFAGNPYVENLIVRNNTAFRCSSACISVPSSGWTPVGTNVAFTGNAAYRTNASQTAISGSGGNGTARLASNVCYGTSELVSGASAGKGLADFRNVAAAAVAPNLDFYPSTNSALTNKIFLAADMPERDFNGTPRPSGAAADAGAYERTSTNNPGSALQAAGKPVVAPAAPVIQSLTQVGGTTCALAWTRAAQWAQVEFCTDLTSGRWISLAGPLYATNANVAPPAGASNGFFRVRLE